MITEPILEDDEERRYKFILACMGTRELLADMIDTDDDSLTELASQCVQTVLLSVGWPLSPPWWGLE